MRILAIETSCDETAIAVLSGKGDSLNLEKNAVYSQIDIHKKYGGVVPEVAARKHLETITPLLADTLGENKFKNIDYLAVTSGPGLVASLILGVTSAKTLAFANDLPLLPVNHIEGHIYSNWLSNKINAKHFPALILVVSGGHTEIILMKGHGDYQLIGQTLDDAVGEAYDKVAKLLDLGYPGGPIVSKLAEDGRVDAYNLPRPMIDSKDYNFSLSGLKTAVLYALEKQKDISKSDVVNMCASFQQSVIDVLKAKVIKAAKEYKVKSIMIAGGVSANKKLRHILGAAATRIKLPFFYPELSFTGDNAAMIAAAAYYKIKSKKAKLLTGKQVFSLESEANWQLVKNKV